MLTRKSNKNVPDKNVTGMYAENVDTVPGSDNNKLDIVLTNINQINSNITEIKVSISEIENKVGDLFASLDTVAKECNNNTSQIRFLDCKMEKLEQYTRRNNLRLFGVQESNGENTDLLVMDVVKNTLNVNISLMDIERTHRIGRSAANTNHPRPIIIKFVSYRVRNEVFRLKKNLKGTKYYFKEDLTKIRVDILGKMIRKFGYGKVWTVDGKFYWNDTNGKIKNSSDLEELLGLCE